MPQLLHQRSTNLLGSFLRRRRQELDLSQLDVAKEMGVTSAEFVGSIETGRRMPNLERLPRLSALLEVTPVELLKLAFADMYPTLVNHIDWTEHRSHAKHKTEKSHQLSTDVLEMAERIERLPEIHQRAISDHIQMHERVASDRSRHHKTTKVA